MPFNLIRDKGREGRRGYTLPKPDVEVKEPGSILPESALRKEKPRLAQVDEPTVIRHYTNLARENEGIDTTFYPLGSCTMKHNPVPTNQPLSSLASPVYIRSSQKPKPRERYGSCTTYRASSPRSPGCLTSLCSLSPVRRGS